ncbi:MAG: secretin and TonB N-terminal domain-containing protein [Armatimonadetes bacterium]|nr:secretin and TonB N-terminal domain-containing protein [Armatimonadota bacterium]
MIQKTMRILGLLLGIAATSAALAAGELTAVSTESKYGGLVVHIKGTDLAKPRTLTLSGGKLIVLRFEAVLKGSAKTLRVRKHGVNYVKAVQYSSKPPIARVAIHANTRIQLKVVKTTAGWDVGINTTNAFAPTEGAATAGPSDSGSALNLGNNADSNAMAAAMRLLKTATKPTAPSAKAETTTTRALTTVNRQKMDVGGPSIPLEPGAFAPVSDPAKRRVSLEFEMTELVLIVKALVEQAGANIVTASDVTGVLTVSLRDVTVEEALDLITKLTGFRYARIDNTFVIGTADFLMNILVHEPAGNYPRTVTRVVALASRKAGQIKHATVKALSLDSLNEKLKIIHPDAGDGGTAAPLRGLEARTTGPDPQAVGEGQPAGAPAQAEGDADYLILIGEKGRVDQAEAIIEQLDDALAQMAGLTPIHAGGSPESLAPITVTYRVQGGKAEELADAVRAYAGPVSVIATPKTSRAGQTIQLFGREAEVERVLQALVQIDSVPDGDLVIEVYDVQYGDPRALRDRLEDMFGTLYVEIGPESAASASYTPPGGDGAGPGAADTGGSGTSVGRGLDYVAKPVFTNRELESKPMTLILRGTPEEIDQALNFLARIDRRPRLIAIEARVMELTREEAIRAGIDWDILAGGNVRFIRLNNSQPGGADNTGGFSTWNSGQWTAEITATLDKLTTKNNLIARPNIVATEGREAVVFIGDIVRYIKTIQATQNGITVEVGEEEVGVKLNVLARIGANNTIILEAQPTVSFISSFLEVPGGGAIPQTSIRTARISPILQNGETVAIGGLISQDERRQVSGIPILMDIPIIGQLFRRTTTLKRKTEIVIFITARIIDVPEASAGGQPGTGG